MKCVNLIDRYAVSVEKCVREVEGVDENDIVVTSGPETPRKRLQRAIVEIIALQPSEETKKALEIAKRKASKQKRGKYAQLHNSSCFVKASRGSESKRCEAESK